MKKRLTRCLVIGIWAAAIVLVTCFMANAHEFIIKPVQLNATVGHKLPFSVVSAHVFMISEETEPIDQVGVSLIKGKNKTDLTLRENPVLMTLDGAVELKNQGTSVLAGHRKGMIWSNTTQGWKQAGKKGLKGVISSAKYEKYCKTLINAGMTDDGYKQVIGHKLEIVPVSNPAEAKVGDYIGFKILFDGKPLSTSVYATYDGFTNRANTYAYFTEAGEQGIAEVKITHSGTWMVRTEQKIKEPTEDYDEHVLRAVLVFEVK